MSSSESVPPIDRVLAPFRAFAQTSASSGIVLVAATAVALLLANSALGDRYAAFWDTKVSIRVDDIGVSYSLLHWINDGLMALFFLVVGLEIKRELRVGELSSVRRASLPIAAAVGGALVPAAIFLALVRDDPASRGWGVPMATDIAFALGILALIGRSAPPSLRVFVAALAIVDDLLAVLVIALFYTSDLVVPALALAAALFGALLLASRFGVRRPLVYAVLGLGLWFAVLESGVHATVAGVLLALAIPSATRLDADAYVDRARAHIAEFEGRTEPGVSASTEEHHAALWELEEATERAQAPMLRIEHALQPWVAWVIVPLFALANAGLRLEGDLAARFGDPIVIGVVAGLVLGKQLGITLGAFVAVRLGIASLPGGVGWRHVYAAGWLGGIGFTMSLFIGSLAYADASAELALAKLGILAASLIAGLGAFVALRAAPRMPA